MSLLVTIEFTVPVGNEDGDYARLHGNNGTGAINWNTPLSDDIYSLFPKGAGIFGFGRAPWGHFFWGHAHSMRTPGWGHLPWGHFPWAHGSAVIKAVHEVNSCGDYKFGFACYDKAGNLYEDTAEEVTVNVHTAPPAPTGLKKNSYNKTTDILILDVV